MTELNIEQKINIFQICFRKNTIAMIIDVIMQTLVFTQVLASIINNNAMDIQ